MARCINTNIKEYKIIRDELRKTSKKKSTADLKATALINQWQEATGKFDEMPSLEEALEFQNNRKISFNLKKRDLIYSIYKNLDLQNRIHYRHGKYYITKTDAKTKAQVAIQLADTLDSKGLTRIADANIKYVRRFLSYYNIPESSATVVRRKTKDGNYVFEFEVAEDLFLPKDVIEESRGFNLPKSRKVANHLKQMFPGVKIQKVKSSEAKKIYEQLPEYTKNADVKFEEVNSFFYKDTAYIIEDRVTDETLIEEMLHPFVETLEVGNKALFDGLRAEAEKTFSELNAQIGLAYSDKKGFSVEDRHREIVTQALTRHFKQEYETQPTKTFLDRVKDFIQFFMKILESMYESMMGSKMNTDSDWVNATSQMIQKSMNVSEERAKEIIKEGKRVDVTIGVQDIPTWATLSQMAQFLNTEGVNFAMYNVPVRDENFIGKPTVKYNLTPRKKAGLEKIRERANDIQNETIDKLFHTALVNVKDSDFYSVTNQFGNRNIVVFDEDTKTYMDILNDGEMYISAEEAVKGRTRIDVDDKLDLLRKDFKTITEAIASGETFDAVKDNLKVFTSDQYENAYVRLKENINGIAFGPEGTAGAPNVIIPQVVVYDTEKKIATTVDLMIIDPHGKVKLINLSINDFSRLDEQYNEGVELADDSILKPLDQKLSKRQQDYIQVNMARRMLENMGYDVSIDKSSGMTFHFNVNQEDNTFEYDGFEKHSPNDNQLYVDRLVPSSLINTNKSEREDAIRESDDFILDLDDILDPNEQLPEERMGEFIDPNVEMSVITGALEAYKKGLIAKRDAMDLLRSKVFSSKSTDKTKEDVLLAINQINVALGSGIKERNKVYSQMLFDSIKEIKKFKTFVTDPQNINDPDYITYVLNFDRFIASYEGLYTIIDSTAINSTQRALLLELRSLLTELGGEGPTQGLITTAVEDFVRMVVKNKSNYNFTEEELDAVIKFGARPEDFIKGDMRGRDIDVLEFGTKDLATSRDTLSAVADKIFKAKVIERNNIVQEKLQRNLRLASRLLKLSSEKDTQKLYHYMIQFDEKGIPTGRIVQELGEQYYERRSEVANKLKDSDGNFLRYREVENIEDASKEDLEWNKNLAQAKAEFRTFMQAETIGLNNEAVDGEYHKYTDEFKKIRSEYEYYDPSYNVWVKRKDVSNKEYARYKAKYYDDFEYIRADRDHLGNFTGTVTFDITGKAVKKRYVEPRLISRNGQDMRSQKYMDMINDTTELGRARLDFYKFWKREFEEDLLNRIPKKQRDQMAGKLPLVAGNFMQDLSKKDPLVVKLWAKATTSVKNFFAETTENRVVYTDEEGKMVDSLPIFYTGTAVSPEQLQKVEAEIKDLMKRRQDGKIKIEDYEKDLKILKGKKQKLLSKPTKAQLNLDLAASLGAFTEMAVHYDLMSGIEDTILAIKKVIENREYAPSDVSVNLGKFDPTGKFQKLSRSNKDRQSNVARRFNKWLHMSYYDDEHITKGWWTKATEKLIQYSSLSYVAFNPFGNFNNYALGRVQDNIEAIGGRFFSASAFTRASYEFNKRAMPDFFYRMGSLPRSEGARLLKTGEQYNPELPMSKYEAVVNALYMMDKKADIRESGRSYGPSQKFWLWEKFQQVGYSMQDAAEYNVQTKVGMAMVIDTMLRSNKTGKMISLYDAYQYNSKDGSVTVPEEYDTVIEVVGKDAQGNPITRERAFNDEFIYDLRNRIREVNKQIHGNYAREDRMVIESYSWGRLLAQFHKWVAPAMRARFQREYYDENLGWMEGRWRSLMQGIRFAGERIVKADMDFKSWQKKFLDDYGHTGGENVQMDQRATNKLYNIYRSMGEAAFIFMFMAINSIIAGMLMEGDDDEDDVEPDDSLQATPESDTAKRLINLFAYQADRTYKELILFVPLLPDAMEQQYQMLKSPIASTRTLGELGTALSLTIWTPFAYWSQSEEDFMNNSDYVYQRGRRTGELKVYKEWKDAVPILYAIKKWENYIDQHNFFIK